MRSAAIALIASLFVPFAQADPYFIFGAGPSRLQTTGQNDLWHQDGFANRTAEQSNAWLIGLGLKLNRWLAVEGDYRNLGGYSAMGLWVGDTPGAAGNYNPVTRRCNGPCVPTSSGYQSGSTDGLGLSLVASPDWTVAPLARVGGFYHRSSFTSSQFWPSADPHSQTLQQFSHDGPTKFSDNGLGWLLGVGVKLGTYFSVEYDYYPKVGGAVSPYSDISTVMLNLRIEL